MWHGDWSGADWALMSVAMVLFWAAVIAGVIWLVRAISNGDRRSGDGVPLRKSEHTGRSTARDILDERYARGELTDEEYRARRDVLSSR